MTGVFNLVGICYDSCPLDAPGLRLESIETSAVLPFSSTLFLLQYSIVFAFYATENELISSLHDLLMTLFRGKLWYRFSCLPLAEAPLLLLLMIKSRCFRLLFDFTRVPYDFEFENINYWFFIISGSCGFPFF